MKLHRTITVDPGLHTGWAYWDKTIYPEVGNIRGSSTKPLEESMEKLWSDFHKVLIRYIPLHCHIEGVETWTGSLKSNIATKTGKLYKLSFLIGGYCRICQQEAVGFNIIPPSRWKGQMNKDMVQKRIRRLNNLEYPNSHITDAVGIGFSLMGIL